MPTSGEAKTPRLHWRFPDLSSGLPFFQPTEHDYIANGVILKGRDPSSPFKLANGLTLTYGDIHMLAGDFYGTEEPIAFGKGDDGRDDDHETRFTNAFGTLAQDPGSPAKAQAILQQIAAEATFIQNFVDRGQGSAKEAWAAWNMRDMFDLEDDSEIGQPGTGADYETLLKLNIDHFGSYARLAYEVGHKIAVATAQSGDLETAYAQNAFAEHFLQDYFASGHMRTPRRQLMADVPKNVCANIMHNEDNNNGLNVIAVMEAPKKRNDDPKPMNEPYQAFGDDSLFESDNVTNLNQAIYALQVSADEIYNAYRGQTAPDTPSAFLYAAEPDAIVRQDNNPCPMFWLVGDEVQMRQGLETYDSSNPPKIPNGNWQFETVVQPKVLYWDFLTYLWGWLSTDQQAELAWACVAYRIAPSGYYSDVAYSYLLDLIKRLWDAIGHLGDFQTEVLAKIEKS